MSIHVGSDQMKKELSPYLYHIAFMMGWKTMKKN